MKSAEVDRGPFSKSSVSRRITADRRSNRRKKESTVFKFPSLVRMGPKTVITPKFREQLYLPLTGFFPKKVRKHILRDYV